MLTIFEIDRPPPRKPPFHLSYGDPRQRHEEKGPAPRGPHFPTRGVLSPRKARGGSVQTSPPPPSLVSPFTGLPGTPGTPVPGLLPATRSGRTPWVWQWGHGRPHRTPTGACPGGGGGLPTERAPEGTGVALHLPVVPMLEGPPLHGRPHSVLR